MPDAVCYISWESYSQGQDGRGFFLQEPLSYNSRQQRLHQVAAGDHLWLVSRDPDDKQYYIVGVLRVADLRRNDASGELGQAYGEYGVIAHRIGSYDLGRKFAAEGLLRSLSYETGKPIKHGASLGQSIQSIRFANSADVILLNYCLNRVLTGLEPQPGVCGLWTKCDRVFADYFLMNWLARRVPQTFFLFDSAPAVPVGAPIFIHSDSHLRLLARFRGSQHVSGYKRTNDEAEREDERDRCWGDFRAGTINPPTKEEFDSFWEKQDSVRSLIVIDNVVPIQNLPQYKEYGRALEWGYPTSVGWRSLDLFQAHYLMAVCGLDAASVSFFLGAILK